MIPFIVAGRTDSPYSGGVKKSSITRKHVPLIWENMLGTVYARNRQGEVMYFDYDYTAARIYAAVSNCSDLRLCRNPNRSCENYPRHKQWALWGIRGPQLGE